MHDAAFFAAGDEACGFEYGKVFHEAGQRHMERLSQLGDGGAALLQPG